MKVIATEIQDVKIIIPDKCEDTRGFFSETYNFNRLQSSGIEWNFVQDNHSFSTKAGTVRGLHFQIPPFALCKLVRVIRGSIFDVALDLRKTSPTFGKHVTVLLSASNWKQILIPIGFAHGFCTLEPNTEVLYKVTHFYSSKHDKGILWNDPQLKIEWPISEEEAIVSEKDKLNPVFLKNPHNF